MLKKFHLSTTLIAILLGVNAAAAEGHQWRFFVADHVEPKISVVQKGKDTKIWDQLAGPARLTLSHDQTKVFAVQRRDGRIDYADTGIEVEDHGDHKAEILIDAKWHGLFMTGAKPTHFVAGKKSVVAFMDGTGSTQTITLSDKAAPHKVSWQVSSKPHHGIGVPIGDQLIISEKNEDYKSSLPNYLKLVDAKGEQVGDLHKCKGMHGKATSNGKLAFACKDGIRLFNKADLTKSKFIAYSKDLGEGRTGRLDGGKDFQYFAGNFGKDKMIFVDVEGNGKFIQTKFEAPLVAGYFDPENASSAFALTANGYINKVDSLSGGIELSVSVMDPIEMKKGHGNVRPSFIFVGEHLALLDPKAAELRLYQKSDLKLAETIKLNGVPASVVAVGVEQHDH